MTALSEYVLKRNGVPLGSKGSLVRTFYHSFGAKSNAKFWKHWNPIWGFHLSQFIYLPLKKYLAQSVAALVAFAVSGALHDLAIGIAGQGWQTFFTIWFLIMGLFLNASKSLGINYGRFGFVFRVIINTSSIVFCFILTIIFRSMTF